ncbi:MAG: ParB N-terminal domain-containing protein, partial [Pseudomonadota bacterium]
EAGHLERDRVVLDAEEMAVLRDSLRDRGQQTPVEVVDLGAGRYGLISGWRRLTALRALYEETGAARFADIKALVRTPDSAADAYRAMVEENEIRADLSFYERAHIACKAVEQGIYPDVHAAVQGLFAAARAPKRSKIVAFAFLVEQLGDQFRFPVALSEKAGLALVAAQRADLGFRTHLAQTLAHAAPTTEAEERSAIDQALRTFHMGWQRKGRASKAKAETVAPGVTLSIRAGGVTLAGRAVDAALIDDLRVWLTDRTRMS